MRLLLLILIFILPGAAAAGEVRGWLQAGYWHVFNDVGSSPSFLADDGYGSEFVDNHISTFFFGGRLDAALPKPAFAKALDLHAAGRLVVRPGHSRYTLGVTDRLTPEVRELNLEAKRVGGAADLWLGIQTVYEAGGETFAGGRAVFPLSDSTDIAFYGGLGLEPRNLSGYIGPSYERNPFTADLAALGTYLTHRGEILRLDAAFRSLLFEGAFDRAVLFSRAAIELGRGWSASALMEADMVGNRGVRSASAALTARPVPGVTNTLGYTMWAPVRFARSDLSAIPPASGLDTAPLGGSDVVDAYYHSIRAHTMVRLIDRNYVFGTFRFTHRTLDNRNQFKYTAGFRDPRLFGSPLDLRIQLDLIDNFRGFNTALDALIGREFAAGLLRLEGGGTFYANEREVFFNAAPDPGQPSYAEREYSLRLNAHIFPFRATGFFLGYTFSAEKDADMEIRAVHLHEILLTTSVRF